METGNLFISYRREGGSGFAGRLLDTTTPQLGTARVFMDAASIAPGDNFVQSLRDALRGCKAMAVVVSPGWGRIVDANGPRLHNPDDWVRIEIETALSLGLRIVPALVGGATMPVASELPPSLRAFCETQAVDLRDATWEDDVRRLVKALGLQRRQSHRFFAAALTVGVVAVIGLIVVLAGPASTPVTGPAATQRALTTLDASPEQQAALVERYSFMGINMLVLKHFLVNARERALSGAQLQSALDVFASDYRTLQRMNFYDDTGVTGAGLVTGPGESMHPCDDAVERMREGDFAATLKALDATAVAVLGKPRVTPDQRVYVAWCRWLRAQTELLDDASGPATADLDEAIKQARLAGEPGQRLLYKLCRDSARLARSAGDTALALSRYEEAATLAGPVNPSAQTGLMLELAEFQNGLNQPAAALQWRERAQKVFDAAHNPDDRAAQASALALAQIYETSNRRAEGKALRERYGLPASP